jgi:hypothetical protein
VPVRYYYSKKNGWFKFYLIILSVVLKAFIKANYVEMQLIASL